MSAPSRPTRARCSLPLVVLVVVSLLDAAVPMAAASIAPDVRRVRVAREGAELRTAPEFGGRVVAYPDAGARFRVVERRREFLRVSGLVGLEGWIHELYVVPDVSEDGRSRGTTHDGTGETARDARVTPGPSATRPPAPADQDATDRRAAADAPSFDAPLESARADVEDTLLQEIARLRDELAAARRGSSAHAGVDDAPGGAVARGEESRRLRADLAATREESAQRREALEAQHAELEACRQSLEEARAESSRLKGELAAGSDETTEHRAELERLRVAVAERDEELATRGAAIAEALRVAADLEGQLATARSAERALQQRVTELEARLLAMEERPSREEMLVALAEARREERVRLEQLHATEMVELEARQDRSLTGFIREVADRHEQVLSIELDRAEADCVRRLGELRREHQRELKVARKESGWEREFRQAVKEEVDVAVEEAEARWEARRRGKLFDAERELEEERERLARDTAAERSAAVDQAVATERLRLDAQLRRVREQEEERCRMALELILSRVAERQGLPETCDALREQLARRQALAAPTPPSDGLGRP